MSTMHVCKYSVMERKKRIFLHSNYSNTTLTPAICISMTISGPILSSLRLSYTYFLKCLAQASDRVSIAIRVRSLDYLWVS